MFEPHGTNISLSNWRRRRNGREISRASLGFGEKWLLSYFKDHQPVAQQAANQNALVFIADLAQRVKVLEQRPATSSEKRERISQALDDPDFSALLHSALIASARTSSESKHALLGRAVAERLASQSESLVALASSLAVEKIPLLTPNQIRFLALLAFAHVIRPCSSAEEAETQYLSWMGRSISCLLPSAEMAPHDFWHLISLGCIQQASVGFPPVLSHIMKPDLSAKDKAHYPKANFFETSALGVVFAKFYRRHMNMRSLTTAGGLIGIYAYDLTVGGETTIDWSGSAQQYHTFGVECGVMPAHSQAPTSAGQ